MNKTVYVNAYTRSDGTHVKEHYRNITGLLPEISTGGTIEEFPQTPYDDMVIWNLDEPLVLEGGVSTDVYLPDDVIIIDMAKAVQDANLAQKYYTLSIVKVPMYE